VSALAGASQPARKATALEAVVALRRRLPRMEPYLYLLPALLSVGIWVYWPMLQALELSFYQWNLLPTRPKVFVGLENYIRVLTLPEMGKAVANTFIYMGGLLPFSVVIPLALAIFVADIKGSPRTIYRVLIFVPVIMAPVVVAVIWRWIMHPSQGILNNALVDLVGIGPFNFFRNETLAIWAVIAITGWKLLGFSFLIFSAGLTNISKDYLEAARIDGAGPWQVVRAITLPLMTPSISFMVMMTILLSGQWVFPLVNVLTQGGPLDATTNIYYILWQFGFRSFSVGWSTASAVIFFVVFALLAWFLVRMIDRFSIYES
jgi:multiple sugar transport system permease protein